MNQHTSSRKDVAGAMLTDDEVLRHFTPIEVLSPLQIGEIFKFLEETDRSYARKTQELFTALVVIEVVLFTIYFISAIIIIGADHPAKDAHCASPVWMWLYCLLSLIIPTFVGVAITMVRGWLHVKELEHMIPTVFFTMAHAINVLVFMVLGVLLMGALYENEECDVFYHSNHFSLYVLFTVQVILFVVAVLISVPLTVFRFYSFCCAPEPEKFKVDKADPMYGYASVDDSRGTPSTLERMYV